MIQRAYLPNIEKWFFKKKVIIVYGARQVGKTTILKLLVEKYPDMQILSSENIAIKEVLESKNIVRIKSLFGTSKIIAIDEAQKIEQIGEVLKYIYDLDLGIQLIATGSSSFDLSNKITEPFTGRNVKFIIYPISISELINSKGSLWLMENIDRLLVYGQYPEMIESNNEDLQILLQNLSSDYLFQDILQQERLKNSNDLLKILRALALQLGNEVIYNELAQTVGLAPQTIERYLDLLEKNFIIYTLYSFSRNLRNELKKSKKIYFNDLGIRNALLSNFADVENRTDKGALWENFCVNERKKLHSINQQAVNLYFWRTYDQAEIDLIEEKDGKLSLFEFKYNQRKSKVKFPASFLNEYDVKNTFVITKANYEQLIEM